MVPAGGTLVGRSGTTSRGTTRGNIQHESDHIATGRAVSRCRGREEEVWRGTARPLYRSRLEMQQRRPDPALALDSVSENQQMTWTSGSCQNDNSTERYPDVRGHRRCNSRNFFIPIPTSVPSRRRSRWCSASARDGVTSRKRRFRSWCERRPKRRSCHLRGGQDHCLSGTSRRPAERVATRTQKDVTEEAYGNPMSTTRGDSTSRKSTATTTTKMSLKMAARRKIRGSCCAGATRSSFGTRSKKYFVRNTRSPVTCPLRGPGATMSAFSVKSCLTRILLLTLSSHASRNRDTNTAERTALKHPCSRPLSRRVRTEIEKQILQPGLQLGYTFPASCPFLATNDLYAEQELRKRRTRGGGHAPYANWECLICGKKFRSEHYMDLHLETVHFDLYGNYTKPMVGAASATSGTLTSSRSSSASIASSAQEKNKLEDAATSKANPTNKTYAANGALLEGESEQPQSNNDNDSVVFASRNKACSADYCELFDACPKTIAEKRAPPEREQSSVTPEVVEEVASSLVPPPGERPAPVEDVNSSPDELQPLPAAEAQPTESEQRSSHDAHCQRLKSVRQKCETSILACYPVDRSSGVADENIRDLSVKLRRKFCAPVDCLVIADEEKYRQQKSIFQSNACLFFLLLLACAGFFVVMLFCVDHADEIAAFLLQFGLVGWAHSLLVKRREAREVLGRNGMAGSNRGSRMKQI
ncbi:unnamed protein product [Amoebophrya sp. A120]|nr:unnamed protein product [Amoebophrya sp. A120]|eukprot:GSA120T00020786001.1